MDRNRIRDKKAQEDTFQIKKNEKGGMDLKKFMINEIPQYLREDFPQGKVGKMCEKLIEKVAEDSKNILHPGHPMEVLDNQIK